MTTVVCMVASSCTITTISMIRSRVSAVARSVIAVCSVGCLIVIIRLIVVRRVCPILVHWCESGEGKSAVRTALLAASHVGSAPGSRIITGRKRVVPRAVAIVVACETFFIGGAIILPPLSLQARS